MSWSDRPQFVWGGITDAGFAHLGTLSNLQILSIHSKNFKGTGFRHLEKLQHLETLYIEGPITDEGLMAISRIPKLRMLDIIDPDFTDEGLKHLSTMKCLENLCVTGAKKITADGLMQLPHAPRLTVVGTYDCPGVPGPAQLRLRKALDDEARLKAIKR